MGIMKTAAVKGIIPAGNKVSELRSNLMRLITEMSVVLEERFGQDGLNAVSEIFRRLGEQDAKAMKERLGFGSTVRDSYDSWAVIGHVMGSKMVPRWVSDSRVEVDHTLCPQYDSFMKRGKLYCEYACLPYVGAVGEGIAPGVKMDVVRAADARGPCTKALEMKGQVLRVNDLVSERVTFTVSNHVLHGVFTSRSDVPGLCALLLHPHPLFGGSMDDRVIRFLESLLARDGHGIFRFGFRGSSSTPEGYSGMRGAVDDALAAVELVQSRFGQRRIAYIGYSFGGATALRLSCEMMPSYLVTLSASLALTTEGGYSLGNLRRIECPTLMFHGTDDRMVQPSDLETLAGAVGTEAKKTLLNGEGHFYQTGLQAVGDAIRHIFSESD